ncbi:MAG TPA: APC family permease [Candidatus Acidoferrales bacterium]|nr:APC family permease [Candidatus Acidoferrales bacterium]
MPSDDASIPSSAVPSPAAPPRILIASTALLSFISFWRAAAIVLNDLASSAYYAGGIAEHAVGRSAPWFIFGIMLFSYAVRAVYVESCSMFVRGGVYRVVKEAMGGTLAKFSVSALMFDYVLTGPISGVSAGQYIVGFINELLRYLHMPSLGNEDAAAAAFAILVTLYFWWQNIKGIPDSSEKALRIMQLTTVMVVLLIGWCGYTLWVRGGHLPPLPSRDSLEFNAAALGWLHIEWVKGIALVGILIGLGHSVLAMSGEESLAQVYREIEHPKLPNLKKAGFVIFLYSLLFTSLVSFFAVMIIPDAHRKEYYDNLIGGLALHLVGPFPVLLAFQGFVVVVGTLILSGAVNTAIVGSNGVLNRVSEDGVLSDWFRQPQRRFGTSYRIINMVVALQVITILLSRGNVYTLGEAYAFGVVWSFVMKALAVLVLRFTHPGDREYRVPLNLRIGSKEIPLGLAMIATVLAAIAITNLLTKQVATISGLIFTLVFFGLFTFSERLAHKRGHAHGELDQFHMESHDEISPAAIGARPGSVLVPISNFHKLYHLDAALGRIRTTRKDVVVLHVRLLNRAGSGESGLMPEQLFSSVEQYLFTQALALAEKHGKPVKLALVAATDVWDAMVRAGVALKSSTIVLGQSDKLEVAEQARLMGLAWERLPAPRPELGMEIFTPGLQQTVFFLGPHTPHLTSSEVGLIHKLWLHYSEALAPEEVHHHDIVHFALLELEQEISEGKDSDLIRRLRKHVGIKKLGGNSAPP